MLKLLHRPKEQKILQHNENEISNLKNEVERLKQPANQEKNMNMENAKHY